MKLKDIVLASLLGACGGLGILTTNFFHAMIPIPGFGALFFLPFSTACIIIARSRIDHPAAATITKLIQQTVILMLPGGPTVTKNPIMIPLMSLDGVLIDLYYRFKPSDLAESKILSGLLGSISGSAGILLQTGLLYLIIGADQFFLAKGVRFFLGIFVAMHGILRFCGGVMGSAILKAIPRRVV